MTHSTQAAATVYRCARCRREILGAPIATIRQATGGSFTHCGTVAYFVRNLTADEAAAFRPEPALPRQSPRPTYRGRAR